MNPISYSLDRLIKFGIPKAILNITFVSRFMTPNESNLYTLSSKIREEIVSGRVMVDMNLVHGTLMDIPLNQCERLRGDYYTSIWRVPKSLTQGKEIISVSEVTTAAGTVATMDNVQGSNLSSNIPAMYASTAVGYNGSGAVVSTQQQIVNSVLPVPVVSNALCYLIGDNTILIKDSTLSPASMYLRVYVENDTNLNHIQAPYYPTVYELILNATRSYIYNNTVIEQDNAYIASGGELNRLKEIIDSYSDAEETYTELLEEWYQSALLNDPESQRRFYQSTVSGGN